MEKTMETQPSGDLSEASPARLPDCDPALWPDILGWSGSFSYSKSEVIIAKGEEAFHVYFVESGTIEVTYGGQEKTIIVAFIGPGELLGEIGFFDHQSRVRTLRAMEDSVIRIWDRLTVEKMKIQAPSLYGAFIELLARSICVKFRRVLEEREPLVAYAASISTGGRMFQESQPMMVQSFQSPFWPRMNQVVETFKADFFNLSIQLQSRFEAAPRDDLQEQCESILHRFNANLGELRLSIEGQESESQFWGYIFKEIFPYFMRSRFAERAYYKPKGYAGDFRMMEMIYANQPQGEGILGELVDRWCLSTSAAKAVRGRRGLLKNFLERQLGSAGLRTEPLRILNLACGSCRELFDFLSEHTKQPNIEAICADADSEALEFTQREVDVFPHRAVIRFLQTDVIRWIIGRDKPPIGLLNCIYSAGLADYLEDRLLQAMATRAYENLVPGGVFIVGNFGPGNPNRAFMDHLLQWKLIHRDSENLLSILSQTPFGADAEVISEPEGVNLFLIARKKV